MPGLPSCGLSPSGSLFCTPRPMHGAPDLDSHPPQPSWVPCRQGHSLCRCDQWPGVGKHPGGLPAYEGQNHGADSCGIPRGPKGYRGEPSPGLLRAGAALSPRTQPQEPDTRFRRCGSKPQGTWAFVTASASTYTLLTWRSLGHLCPWSALSQPGHTPLPAPSLPSLACMGSCREGP